MDVAAVIRENARDRDGMMSTAQLFRHGVSASAVSRAATAGEVVRLRRGVYSLAALPALPRFLVTADGAAPAYVARVRSHLLAVPAAAAAGRTAAVLRGWGMLVEPSARVELSVPYGARPGGRGVRVVRDRRRDIETAQNGLRMTSAVSTVVDCALERSLLESVVIADSALRAGDVTVEQLAAAVSDLRGRREATRVRRVVALCDPESGSVLESVLRVRLVLAGIVGLRTQAVLAPDGQAALRVDFAFDAARLVVEADGSRWHPDAARDRERDNRLARLGWRVLRYGWSDVVHNHRRVVAEVREALLAASAVVHVGEGATSERGLRAA